MRCSLIVPSVEAVLSAFERCLPSFVAHEGRAHEIIVIDDGSPSDVQERARERCRRQGVRFLSSTTNRGYTATVNQGIQASGGDVIVLANTDVRFTRPVLGPMLELFAARKGVGIVGGLLLYPDRRIQHGGIVLERGRFAHRGHRRRHGAALEVELPCHVIGCTGALVGIRRAMIDEIGPLNEELELAMDDVEYGLRAWSRGWEVYYSPEVQAEHQEGGTRGNSWPTKLRRSFPWVVREVRTYRRFRRILAGIDLPAIEAKVAQANLRQHSTRQTRLV